MNRCLEEECHKKGFLFYKKKPQKLLVLEQIEESKNLLLINLKLKNENAARIRKDKRLKAKEEKRLKAEEDKRLKAEEEKRFKAEEEKRFKAEEEKRFKAEEEKKLKAEEASRLKEEVKLEEISIKDQEQVAENNKKKALHESIEREKAEKLKKIGITKRKNK